VRKRRNGEMGINGGATAARWRCGGDGKWCGGVEVVFVGGLWRGCDGEKREGRERYCTAVRRSEGEEEQ
jgi:hypothetical protein